MNIMLYLKRTAITIIIISLGGIIFAQHVHDTNNVFVTGIVYDAASEMPMEGVAISSSGISSTFTDSTGFFSIKVPSYQATIFVQEEEYQDKEVFLKGKNNILIYLYEKDYVSFNEYANTYYSVKPLAYTTNSVVTQSTKNEGWKNPGTSSEEIFKDKIPGLTIKTRSGVLGIGSNMYLRGFSSIYASNQPLIIVDGMIYDNKQYGESIITGFLSNPLSYIDINDIENVTVCKDAVSIYGAKASNGIIFIRTHHASKMATKIDFTSYGGINFAPKQTIPVLQADDYRIYLAEMLQSSGLTPDSIQSLPFMIDSEEYPDYYRYHNNTNWQNLIYNDSYNQNFNLKISGGDDVALYALSLGYLKHEGIIKNTGFSRYSIRFNSDITISTKLIVNANLGFAYNQQDLKEDGYEPTTNPIYLSLTKSPFTYPNVRTPSGTISPNLEDVDILGVGNPVSAIENLEATSKNYRIFGAFNVNYQISKHLSASNLIGFNFDKGRDNLFVPHVGIANDTLDLGIAENKMAHKVERIFSFNNDFRLNYNHSFSTIHHFSSSLGVRLSFNQVQDDWGKGYNSPNDEMRSVGTGVSYLRTVGGYIGNWKQITFYASADYNYQYKYFLTLNMSLDGSSRFGNEANGISMFGGKFGIFPSVATAWLISSEKFLADINVISLLKLRASYGITGNDDIGDHTAKKYYISQNLLGSQGLIKGTLWNPKLQWETNKKLNTGLDLSLFRERLSLSFDYYQNKTEDLLNIIDANPLSGFDTYIENNGAFQSTGFEVALNSRILNHTFKWDIGINIANYKTEIIEFPENQRITNLMGATILTAIGEPIGLFYGYKTLGVFATQAEAEASGLQALMPNTDLVPFAAGDIHFEDIDGNNIIDENDRQIIGDPNPDFTGMLMNRFKWKGLAFETCIAFSYGNDIYNHLRYQLESMQNTNNQTLVILNRWKTEGQVTEIPKATWGDPIGNSRFSDRWIEDGSYIRLRYVTLSYDIPLHLRAINSLEVFISGYNLVTFTNYLGLDPEFSMSEFSLAQGIDIALTPQARSVFMGIKIGL